MRTTRDSWHKRAVPRTAVIDSFAKDAKKLAGDTRPILFCFLTDPYQPLEAKERITHQALEIVDQYGLRSKVLTKGFYDIISRDFPLLKSAGTELGLTISFVDDRSRREWEPHAAPLEDRFRTLEKAFSQGIYTWISLEPVIDPVQALALIRKARGFVRYWKIGKLNHMKAVEETVDWRSFLEEAEQLLKEAGAEFYIKNDLEKYR